MYLFGFFSAAVPENILDSYSIPNLPLSLLTHLPTISQETHVSTVLNQECDVITSTVTTVCENPGMGTKSKQKSMVSQY